MSRKRNYGWQPDLPDFRDRKFCAAPEVVVALPPSVNLQAQCPPVFDQGDEGSCTGQSSIGGVMFDLIKQCLPNAPMLSRNFVYWNGRAIEGKTGQDSGAQIRDVISGLQSLGACPESLWPYEESNMLTKPSDEAFAAGLQYQVTQAQRLTPTLDQLKGCLAAGYPFVFGITVYASFESDEVAQTGIVPMPDPSEQCLGGHAVLAVGYDDATQTFLVRNSWGAGWGQSGYFTIPYEYLTNSDLADDFWTIRAVAMPPA